MICKRELRKLTSSERSIVFAILGHNYQRINILITISIVLVLSLFATLYQFTSPSAPLCASVAYALTFDNNNLSDNTEAQSNTNKTPDASNTNDAKADDANSNNNKSSDSTITDQDHQSEQQNNEKKSEEDDANKEDEEIIDENKERDKEEEAKENPYSSSYTPANANPGSSNGSIDWITSDTASATALMQMSRIFTQAQIAIITTPDAGSEVLCAASLAGAYHSPLLFTNAEGGIDASVLDYLRGAGVMKFVLVASKSHNLVQAQNALSSIGEVVTLSGANSSDLSISVLDYGITAGLWKPVNITLANSADVQVANICSGYVFRLHEPVLLTDANGALTLSQKKIITSTSGNDLSTLAHVQVISLDNRVSKDAVSALNLLCFENKGAANVSIVTAEDINQLNEKVELGAGGTDGVSAMNNLSETDGARDTSEASDSGDASGASEASDSGNASGASDAGSSGDANAQANGATGTNAQANGASVASAQAYNTNATNTSRANVDTSTNSMRDLNWESSIIANPDQASCATASILATCQNAPLLSTGYDDISGTAARYVDTGLSTITFSGEGNMVSSAVSVGMRARLGVYDVETYSAGISISDMANKEVAKYADADGRSTRTKDEVLESMDPSRASRGSENYFVFAKLSDGYSGAVSADQINAFIDSIAPTYEASYGCTSVMRNTGASFIEAARESGVNEVYLLAHAILESACGCSQLARGSLTGGMNMFGIAAYDSDPNNGASYASSQGWTSADAAIKGGGAWISSHYIHSSYAQDTIYQMRWNVSSGSHQYATSLTWANSMAKLMNRFYTHANISLEHTGLNFKVIQY